MTWRRRPKWRTTKDVSRIVDDDDITAREIDWIKAFTDNDTVYAWLDDGCTVQGGGGGEGWEAESEADRDRQGDSRPTRSSKS